MTSQLFHFDRFDNVVQKRLPVQVRDVLQQVLPNLFLFLSYAILILNASFAVHWTFRKTLYGHLYVLKEHSTIDLSADDISPCQHKSCKRFLFAAQNGITDIFLPSPVSKYSDTYIGIKFHESSTTDLTCIAFHNVSVLCVCIMSYKDRLFFIFNQHRRPSSFQFTISWPTSAFLLELAKTKSVYVETKPGLLKLYAIANFRSIHRGARLYLLQVYL